MSSGNMATPEPFKKKRKRRGKPTDDAQAKRLAAGLWHTEEEAEYRVVHLDHNRCLFLVSEWGSRSLTFQVNGRLQLWPLGGHPVEVSGVPVSWETAQPMGGVTVWSPATHALHTVRVVKAGSHGFSVPTVADRIRACLVADASSSCPTDVKTLALRLQELVDKKDVVAAFLCCRCAFSVVVDVLRGVPELEQVFAPCVENTDFRLQLVDGDEESIVINVDALTEGIEEMKRLIAENPAATMMLVGGKNTGKSTTVRHLVNTALLSDHLHIDTVAVLDCDPGQTEFTPPAFVSVTEITRPLFGPPFTHCHLKPVSKCFFGSLTPSSDPSFYVKCLKNVYQRWLGHRQSTNSPLVVNTMGWTEGIGRCLLVDTIRLVKPDLVIQLCSSVERMNFEKSLSATNVMIEDGWTRIDETIQLDYKLHVVDKQLASSCLKGRFFSPSEHRNLTLLGHLSNIIADQPDIRSLEYSTWYEAYFGNRDLLNCLLSIPPVRLPWKSLAIHSMVADAPIASSVILLSINASLVSLNRLSEAQWQELVVPDTPDDHPRIIRAKPLCESLGIGLVRAVDPTTREILIVSAVPKEELKSVNCILSGRLDLPTAMVLPKLEREKDVPYIGETVNSGIGRTSIRKERAHVKPRRQDNE